MSRKYLLEVSSSKAYMTLEPSQTNLPSTYSKTAAQVNTNIGFITKIITWAAISEKHSTVKQNEEIVVNKYPCKNYQCVGHQSPQ